VSPQIQDRTAAGPAEASTSIMAESFKTEGWPRVEDRLMAEHVTDVHAAGPLRTSTLAAYLAPGEYVDSGHPAVIAAARRLSGEAGDQREAACALYRFVREMTYEGDDFEDLDIFRASHVLAVGHGYCVSKASSCTALARAAGIPARIAFADVRSHLASPRTLRALATDTFAWHGYVEMYLDNRWVKASPTFDAATCARAGVEPLEFDGAHDALLQSFDATRTMRYVKHHGSFHDVPARFLSAEMLRLYPFARDRGISRYKAGRLPGEA
jgi:transglutaminase-like putative cysteine protease